MDMCLSNNNNAQQIKECGHGHGHGESVARGEPHVKAMSPYHELMQLHVGGRCARGHNGIVLSDSLHVIVPRTQRHFLAVGDRDVEAPALGINSGDSVHGARGHVCLCWLEKE